MAFKGKRTFLVAALLAVFGALETLNFTDVMTEESAQVVVIVISALMAILRAVTNTPPGKAEPVTETTDAPE